jgi:hypothetical protein
MCDVVDKLEAYPIPIASYFKELETQAIRTYPDNRSLIEYIVKFYHSSNKNEISTKTRTLTEQHYNWDNIALKWETYLDKLSDTYVSKWDDPPQILPKIDTASIPANISNIDMVQFIFDKYLKHAYALDKNVLDMLKQADYGFTINGMSIAGYNAKDIIEYFNTLIDNNNQAEYARVNKLKFNDDYIEYANIKDNK